MSQTRSLINSKIIKINCHNMPQHSLLQSAISSHQERIVGLQERNGAHQNRTENYKFMRLSLLLFREKKTFRIHKNVFIHKVAVALGAWDYEWTQWDARLPCMCVDLIIFLFLSVEHLLWLSATLLCSGFLLSPSCFFLRVVCVREDGMRSESVCCAAKALECEHLESSPDDD